MAEDDDGVSNQKFPKNSEVEGSDDKIDQSQPKPDLGIAESKFGTSETNPGADGTEAANSTSKTGGAIRKEENPFSFRHFLKRDLSLPGNATFENTGARPKVYANTVQHSPTEGEARRDKTQAKESHRTKTCDRENVDLPIFSVENKSKLYNEEAYYRPNVSAEPLGMPSLPDFVQDHILVEQVYLNQEFPINVDMDKLPDFTLTSKYGGGYEECSEGARWCPREVRDTPHLNLDLTECVNPADRRNTSPRNSFPLDLPGTSGAESMRLPDFLPEHPGRISPDGNFDEHYLLQAAMASLELTKSELTVERSRRSELERELKELRARHEEDLTASWLNQHYRRQNEAGPSGMADNGGQCSKSSEDDDTVTRLKTQLKKVKEELSISQMQTRELQTNQRAVVRNIRLAASHAEASIKQLLEGVEQLKSLATTLDPP